MFVLPLTALSRHPTHSVLSPVQVRSPPPHERVCIVSYGMTRTQIRHLFSNFSQLLKLNQHFLADLEKRTSHWDGLGAGCVLATSWDSNPGYSGGCGNRLSASAGGLVFLCVSSSKKMGADLTLPQKMVKSLGWMDLKRDPDGWKELLPAFVNAIPLDFEGYDTLRAPKRTYDLVASLLHQELQEEVRMLL